MVSTKKSQAYTALKLKARARHAAEITVHEDLERAKDILYCLLSIIKVTAACGAEET